MTNTEHSERSRAVELALLDMAFENGEIDLAEAREWERDIEERYGEAA